MLFHHAYALCRRGRSRSEAVALACRRNPSRFRAPRPPVTSSGPEPWLHRVTWPPRPRSRSRSRWRAEPTAAANCRRPWRPPAEDYEYSDHHGDMLTSCMLIRLSDKNEPLLIILITSKRVICVFVWKTCTGWSTESNENNINIIIVVFL